MKNILLWSHVSLIAEKIQLFENMVLKCTYSNKLTSL